MARSDGSPSLLHPVSLLASTATSSGHLTQGVTLRGRTISTWHCLISYFILYKRYYGVLLYFAVFHSSHVSDAMSVEPCPCSNPSQTPGLSRQSLENEFRMSAWVGKLRCVFETASIVQEPSRRAGTPLDRFFFRTRPCLRLWMCS